MNIPWRLYPFVRVTIAFMLGILLERFAPDLLIYFLPLSLIVLFFLVYKDYFTNKNDMSYPAYAGVMIIIFFFFFGYIRSALNIPTLDNKHYSHFAEKYDSGIGIIQEIPIIRTSLRTEIELTHLCKDNNCIEVNQKAIIYFKKEDQKAINYKPGDKIYFNSKLTLVNKTTNPFAFDFHAYLWNRGITHQTYVWHNFNHFLIDQNNLGFLNQIALNARGAFLNVFNKYLKDPDQNAIASAMILGYRNMVSEDMYKAFSDSGSVHILAVSGMHLGILAFILVRIFDKIKSKNKIVIHIKIIAIIFLLWFFALITGAAPAIIRAAIMFTFILYGKYTKKLYNSYNILAFCSILMLAYDPYLLFQASFQFSFLAMLSLSYFQERISLWYIPENKVLAGIWEYVTAALAAQILVVPFTIYFFHKFPVYFIISGVVSVWLSTIALYAGLLVMLLEFILPSINVVIVPVFKLFLTLFIYSVKWVKALPLASIDGLTLNNFEFFISAVFLISFMFYWHEKNFKYLLATLLSSLIFIFSLTYRLHIANHQKFALVYDVNKSSIIDFFDGRNVFYFQLDSLKENQLNFINYNNRIFHFTKTIKNIDYAENFRSDRILKNENIIQFKNVNFAFIFDEKYKCMDYSKINYFFILSNAPIDECSKFKSNSTFILDKSNSIENVNDWKNFALKHKINFIDIRKTGSYKIEI